MLCRTLAILAVIGLGMGSAAQAADRGNGAAEGKKSPPMASVKLPRAGDPGDGDATIRPAAAKMSHGSSWGYRGNTGPENWGALSPAYRACSAGHAQSPIDISQPERAQLSPITFHYRLTPLNILHNGHTIQVNYRGGSKMMAAGKEYKLIQFHFHTRSEHKVDGKSFPMEMHLVHKNGRGDLAVVGLLIEQGDENPALREIWDHLPAIPGPAKSVSRVMINARDFLPESPVGYFRYMGSLTTPPCSEGVNWFVVAKPIHASAAQIRTISRLMGRNARPVQPRHNRLVLDGGSGQ